MNLNEIKGISDKRIADFSKLGVNTVEELIKLFPKNYIDLTRVIPVKDSFHNECVLTVARVETEPRVVTGGRVKFVKVYCSQGAYTFSVVWFNQPYVATKLKRDTEYFFYGRVSNKFGMVSMNNPVFEEIDKHYKLKGIVPVYPLRGNLTQSVVKKSILEGVKLLKPESIIPYNLQQKYTLSSLNKAYYDVHNPPNEKARQLASDRIALEEYFSLISAFKVIKGDKKNIRINKYNCSATKLKEFTNRLHPVREFQTRSQSKHPYKNLERQNRFQKSLPSYLQFLAFLLADLFLEFCLSVVLVVFLSLITSPLVVL
jgi:ATP-dependent DNA helicase RecG